MRKSSLYKLTASIVLVSAIAVSTSSVLAQRRSNQNDKTRYEEPTKSTRLRESDKKVKYNKSNYSAQADRQKTSASKKQSAYSQRDRNKKNYSSHNKHADVYGSRKYSKGNRDSYSTKSYHYSGDRYKNYKYPKAVHSNRTYRNFHNDHGHNCYRHDRYGNVVLRFAVAPVVIRHTYGDYYYSNGDYYRFYPEVGYVMVDAPSSLYFSYVPDNCHRVYHHGNEYYTNGSVYFVKGRNGFRLVNAPSGIHLSFKF